MSEVHAVMIDTGFFIEGSQQFAARVAHAEQRARELLRVTYDDEVTLADDLTLDEAKALLIEMAGKYAKVTT
jgi:hypothetical protein